MESQKHKIMTSRRISALPCGSFEELLCIFVYKTYGSAERTCGIGVLLYKRDGGARNLAAR
jgi:hypothetical protein